jgi:hypothetical protein
MVRASVQQAMMKLLLLFISAGCVSCASAPIVTPLVQRIVIVGDTVNVYKLSGERRLYAPLGAVRKGDTLISYAHAVVQADSVERLFYVVFRGAEGWLYHGNSRLARSEYDAVASVFDTKFVIPPEADSAAWKRALDFVQRHSIRPLQTVSDVLIEHSPRGKITSERDVAFVVRRVVQPGGVAYSVRADGSSSHLNARKCAFYIQTGKDERDFQGMNNTMLKTPQAR